jgi:hypothetical protein
MKSVSLSIALFSCIFTFTNAQAGKPVKDDGSYIGNGYPGGPHFNLNIHGKNGSFQCPEPTYYWVVDVDGDAGDDIAVGDLVKQCPDLYSCTETTEQYYGNVINLPRDGSDVRIFAESGRKGPKSSPDVTTLEVTDWCTKPFDDDAASFRLPADPDGYAVYTRVAGKPVENQFFEVFGRDLTVVEIECQEGDEDPNCLTNDTYDLLLLGVVTEDGAFVKIGNGDGDFERVDDSDGRGGKGVKNATDITRMFEFSGDVCYVYADDPACVENVCSITEYCCPTDWDTGLYSGACEIKIDNPLFSDGLGGFDCNVQDEENVTDWIDQTFYCHHYEDYWIFNIADFVEVLFSVRNNDTYNIKLRFYPLPLQDTKVKN